MFAQNGHERSDFAQLCKEEFVMTVLNKGNLFQIAPAQQRGTDSFESRERGGMEEDPALLAAQPTHSELSDVPASIRTRESHEGAEGFAYVAVDRIRFSPYQTREIANESELEELARSIESRGILQPILVRPYIETDSVYEYELIAGERRLRAARMVGLAFVPAVVHGFADVEAAEASIIENAQRKNLNPIEEARALMQLQEQFRLNQSEIAQVIGKNRATISNSLRLLQLGEEIIAFLEAGDLSAGHGRALLRIQDERTQLRLAKRAISSGLSVHQLERLVAAHLEQSENAEEEYTEDELRERATLERQENKIADLLGLQGVRLRHDSEGRKRLNLVFETEASWKRFMSKVRS